MAKRERIKIWVNVYQNLNGEKVVFQTVHLNEESAKKTARHREELKYLFTVEYDAYKLVLIE